MTEETKDWIWAGGAFVERNQLVFGPHLHALHYGTGFFEGLRSYRQSDGGIRIFRLEDHLKRFFQSAERMRVKIPHTLPQLANACEEVIARNNLDEAYIRPLAFIDNPFYFWAKTTGSLKVVVMAVDFPSRFNPDAIPTKRAVISPFRRSSHNLEFHQAKCIGHYSMVSVAAQDTFKQGFDQAIFLDERGLVCEALTDNVFIVKKGEVMTPSVRSPILLGITRNTALEIFRAEGVPVGEKDVTLDDLRSAEEAFTTSTAGGIQAIVEVDGSPIGNGTVGPVTRKLYSRYTDRVRGAA